MSMPLVSIILPVYGVEAYIGECLASVMAQEANAGIECLIVDDCTPDRSIEIAREVIESYTGPIDFKIIRRAQNGGLSAARNTGIRAATGRYIYLLDSDDVITADCIQSLVEAAKRYPEAEIISGDFQTFPEKNQYKALMLEGKNVPVQSREISWIHANWFTSMPETAWNKLVNIDWLRRNDLYFLEGVLHEDTHWRALMYSYVSSVAFVDKKTYLYRIRQGSITQSEGAMERRVLNLGILYCDLFSRPLLWDAPLLLWAFNALNEMKFGDRMGFDATIAKHQYCKMIQSFRGNRSIPAIARLLARYHTLPRVLMRGKIITLTIDKIYNK